MSWSVFDATDISITPGTGSLPLSGSMKVHPAQTTTYILKASNKHGSTQATTVVSVETDNVLAKVPVIKSFQASSEKILSGENDALSWSVSGATSVAISPEVGSVQSDGSILVGPTQTTIYVMTATNEAGSVRATTVVSVDENVDPPTIDSFSASPEEIAYGQSSILSWNVSGATSVNIAPGIGDVPLSGSRTVRPAQNTVYTIKAANKAGDVKATSFVSVEKINLPTIEFFNASSEKIYSGDDTTLSWIVDNATYVVINPGIGQVQPSGSKLVSPTQNTTYTLIATNEAGSVKATTDVVVNELVAASDFKLPIIIGTTRKTINISGFHIL